MWCFCVDFIGAWSECCLIHDCPFKVTGGCELDTCFSGVKRVIENIFEDADILFQ